jgi:uncharacterized protein (TIGR03437 family)
VSKRCGHRLSRVLALLLFGVAVHPQSVPTLSPPDQAYIYNFDNNATTVNASAPAAPALNLGVTYSIEFWMMLSPFMRDGQNMEVLNKGLPTSGNPYAAYNLGLLPGTHQLGYFQSTGSPGSDNGANIPVSLALGQWYHVAIVSNNLQVTLYLNGQPQGQLTAFGPVPNNSSPLTFGQFPGSMRQFRVWNRALQASEIPSFATKTLTGSEPGLIADWPMDDGQGEVFRDVGPNHLALNLVHGYLKADQLYPNWMRTAIVNGGPYFQERSLLLPHPEVQDDAILTPIDFGSDGNVDLLVCGGHHTTAKAPCAAFRNDGKGNFTDVTAQVLGPNPPAFEGANHSCVADFNGDGRADVFINNAFDCGVCGSLGDIQQEARSGLLLQTADGRLKDVADTNLPQQIYTIDVVCGDIDRNGTVDLVLINPYQASQIWLNDGQGHFTVADSSRLPAALLGPPSQFEPGTARFIDVNKDGHLDLFVGASAESGLPKDLLLMNDGQGFFTLAPDSALPTRYGGRNWGTGSHKVVDLNGDGWPDLINLVASFDDPEGAVQILLNNRDGTFRDATEQILQPAWARHGNIYADVADYLSDAFPADFNGDGYIDLLVQGNGQASRLFLNTGPAGGYRLVEVTELLPDSADVLAVADFNGDGSPDVAAWNRSFTNPSYLETWISSRNFKLTPELTPPVPTGPFFLRGGVLSSASYSANALAPGELVTIYGRNLGPDTLAVASPDGGVYPTQLSGTRVLFDNVAAPIIYTSAGVVSTIVPFSVVPRTRSNVVVEYQGTQSPSVSIYVFGSAPALFTSDSSGVGPTAVLNYDPLTRATSINSPQNPAPRGGIIIAYITGAGQTVPPSTDGILATSAGQLALPIEAAFNFQVPSFGFSTSSCEAVPAYYGCQPLQVLYAGPAPGLVNGVTQVNLLLPNSASLSGTRDLGISVEGVWSQWHATVSIQ